jgi:hypothetical protein
MSGSSTATRASKSPLRAAARNASTTSAGELARRVGRAVDDGGDLVERDREHVVEDVGEPLRRRQGLEHDEQREADRVGEQRLVLGVAAVRGLDDRVRQVGLERLLAPGLA